MQATLLLLLFFVITILFGIAIRQVVKNTAIPYSVALLICGMLLGTLIQFDVGISGLTEVTAAFKLASQLDGNVILFIFLPALVFEAAFSLETHLFKRMLSQIAILAVPGLILCTLLTAILCFFLLPWHWPFAAILMFSAIISATDPVAVVSLLKERCSRVRLQTLIEGESLLNDGTAIVLFGLFLSLLTQVQSELSLLHTVLEFIRVVAIGIIIGLVIGGLSLWFIGRVFNDSLIEITLTIVLPYLVFYLAEHQFHASGVVSVVTLALLYAGPGRTRFSPEVIKHLHHFWHNLSFIFNTLIFILVGLVVVSRLGLQHFAQWPYLILLFVGLLIIRGLVVLSLSPILGRLGIGITREKSIVLIWGGLRGAVSLALALIVATNTHIDSQLGEQILFLSAGIVVLSIIINGSSMGYLMKKLNLDKMPEAKQKTFNKVQEQVKGNLLKQRLKLQNEAYLSNVDWESVDKKLSCELTSSEEESSHNDSNTEYLRKLLELERQFYWNLFAKGLLSQAATNLLVRAIERALDEEPQLYPRPYLIKHWQLPHWLQGVSRLPLVKAYAQNALTRRHILIYESARGLFEACDSIKQEAEELSPSKAQFCYVGEQIASLQNLASECLAQYEKEDLLQVEKIESHLAFRIMLNTHKKTLEAMSKQGLLSQNDADKLIKTVELKMYQSEKYKQL